MRVCVSLTGLLNLLEACRFHTSFPSVLLKRSHKSHRNSKYILVVDYNGIKKSVKTIIISVSVCPRKIAL